jgi:putative oxidoreductase
LNAFQIIICFREGKAMLRKVMSTTASWAPLPLRLALGIAFIGHGAQKVFGKFGGPGWSNWTSLSAAVPFSFMRPAPLWLGAAAISELVGGVLVLLGLLTRLGAFLIVCVMITAIKALWPAYFAPTGFELASVMLAMALALLVLGGGQVSVDRMIGRRR